MLSDKQRGTLRGLGRIKYQNCYTILELRSVRYFLTHLKNTLSFHKVHFFNFDFVTRRISNFRKGLYYEIKSATRMSNFGCLSSWATLRTSYLIQLCHLNQLAKINILDYNVGLARIIAYFVSVFEENHKVSSAHCIFRVIHRNYVGAKSGVCLRYNIKISDNQLRNTPFKLSDDLFFSL